MMKRLSTFLLFATLLFTFLFVAAPFSRAQPYYRGEVEFAADSSLSPAFSAQTSLTLAGHLEAGYDLDLNIGLSGASPLAFSLVLDPSVRVGQTVTTEPGLTELYATTTYGDLDFSLGAERLPLETARLSVPYTVETVGARGVRHGVPGVRGVLYRGAWRVRGAVFYRDTTYSNAEKGLLEQVTPLMSVRRAFGGFDLEAHALYHNGLVTGLGGSGLVGDVVVYGEAWLLAGAALTDLSGRGAVGLNGNLSTGTWTLEGAYLTPGEVSLKDDLTPAQLTAAVNPRPAVLGQVTLPLGDEGDMSLALNGTAFFDPDALRTSAGASYTLLSDAELTLAAAARFGPKPVVATLSLSLRGFF